jgi:hypothetical protein
MPGFMDTGFGQFLQSDTGKALGQSLVTSGISALSSKANNPVEGMPNSRPQFVLNTSPYTPASGNSNSNSQNSENNTTLIAAGIGGLVLLMVTMMVVLKK